MTTAIQTFANTRKLANPYSKDPEAVTAYRDAVETLNQTARERWGDPEFHREVAADLQSILDYGFSYESFFPDYFDIQMVGEFDRVTLRERRGLKAFYTSRGGYIEESQIRDQMWELPRDTIGFHVSEHIDKLRANFAYTIESIVTLGQNRLEAEINRRVLSLMQAAVPSGAANYTNATTGITDVQVNAAIMAVKDAIRPDGAGTPQITVLGRAPVVDRITSFNFGYDPEAAAEIRQRGRLGTYRGANVQVLHHFVDEENVAFMPANEMWVFAGSVGKFVTYGGLQVHSWDENTVDYRHYRARRDFGGLVHHPEQAWRLVDGTITP